MSTRTIPAEKIVTCDCCQKDVGSPGVKRVQSGGLHLLRDGLDMHGHACANADVKLDLCDSCLQIIATAINQACTAVRSAT